MPGFATVERGKTVMCPTWDFSVSSTWKKYTYFLTEVWSQ